MWNTSRELQQLQHCNKPPLAASYGYCFLFICFVAPFFKNHAKQKNSSKGFVNRNLPFVPLHCQKKGELMTPARTSLRVYVKRTRSFSQTRSEFTSDRLSPSPSP